jgi:hypothetical protein
MTLGMKRPRPAALEIDAFEPTEADNFKSLPGLCLRLSKAWPCICRVWHCTALENPLRLMFCYDPSPLVLLNDSSHFDPEGHQSLYFTLNPLQSRMCSVNPMQLDVDYTCTMMGFLMFNARPARIAMFCACLRMNCDNRTLCTTSPLKCRINSKASLRALPGS